MNYPFIILSFRRGFSPTPSILVEKTVFFQVFPCAFPVPQAAKRHTGSSGGAAERSEWQWARGKGGGCVHRVCPVAADSVSARLAAIVQRLVVGQRRQRRRADANRADRTARATEQKWAQGGNGTIALNVAWMCRQSSSVSPFLACAPLPSPQLSPLLCFCLFHWHPT
jgi:hypothetical protein